ncbi:adenine deaminase [Metabacillus litoralis]|uniref:adenine deaminase n=1 Tax=Metabacillus litoralis TaxID=152268 RepID=UPI001CFD437F|nr:adenine deaminase [Metabacillus litoralis]
MNRQNKRQNYIATAGKNSLPDTVIKNGKIVDVFNGEIIEQDVAIHDGMIVGIGEYEGKTVIDAKGQFICPGLIDAHVHIESSLVSPSQFAQVVLPHGVTSIITDPHEIANVSGVRGIQYMIDNSEGIPLDVFFMLPSSVPATTFENNGATLLAENLLPFLKSERVLGLAEVMDFPAVKNRNPEMMKKLELTQQIDGHGAGLDKDGLNIYRAAGIQTDHEATTAEEAKERLQRGMYLLIREGSVAKDLKALLPVVKPHNLSRCMFCTDDKHLDDLIKEGSIDHNVRLAIQEGMDPITAITMASLNPASCYGLKTKGAIAPGFEADFFFTESLEEFVISSVYKGGSLVGDFGKYIGKNLDCENSSITLNETVRIDEVRKKDLVMPLKTNIVNVIGVVPNSLVTRKIEVILEGNDSEFYPSVEKDLLKMAVIERHHYTGNIGLGIVRGFQLKKGAIATTIAHDSHNLVVAGTNDEDMIKAIKALTEMQGGLVYVVDGEIIASLTLSIAGLFSDHDFNKVNEELIAFKNSLKESGFDPGFNPFLTLSFLTLPVIPEVKLTDKGLFDMSVFKHISVEV